MYLKVQVQSTVTPTEIPNFSEASITGEQKKLSINTPGLPVVAV